MGDKYEWKGIVLVEHITGKIVGSVSYVHANRYIAKSESPGACTIGHFISEDQAKKAVVEYVEERDIPQQLIPTGELSDGYHTFNELYDHRHALFINLVDAYSKNAWFSLYHENGDMFDDMFIVGLDLPASKETITYHLPLSLLDMLKSTEATQLDFAPKWDGHTPAEVVERLYRHLAGVL